MPELTQTGMTVLWSVLLAVFLAAEALTFQLVSVWFAFGALGGLIVNLCRAPFVWQVLVFVVVSFACLIATRPLVRKFTADRIQKTNLDRSIGADAVVLEEIDNTRATGQVRVDGKVWTARSSDGAVVPAGAVVTVEKIEGAKLIVKNK